MFFLKKPLEITLYTQYCKKGIAHLEVPKIAKQLFGFD